MKSFRLPPRSAQQAPKAQIELFGSFNRHSQPRNYSALVAVGYVVPADERRRMLISLNVKPVNKKRLNSFRLCLYRRLGGLCFRLGVDHLGLSLEVA